ncbi:MAG: glycoside hydrolase family 5 protein [Candidatus Omnitrophota bacterium]
MMKNLSVNNGRITDGVCPVSLRGVNLGGWLMPEAYFTCAPNRGYRYLREGFVKVHGEAEFRTLATAFRAAFITEKDFAQIAGMGFNSVRLPFHYALMEESPYVYSHEGVACLDQAIRWGKKYHLRIILDMHAVPGAQNHDWHSDSDGKARFWTSKAFQRRAIALWVFLADRFKDEPVIAGYDLLNEAVTGDDKGLNAYYQALIKAIRAVDKNHILFVEGNRWAQDIECLDNFDDKNLVLGIHFYEPLEFTFNFVPGLKYPLIGKNARWDKAFMRQRLEALFKVAQKRGRALWCGEFGVNARDGLYGEDVWLSDILTQFNTMGIHWTYWTWKAVKHHMFPDGVNSYLPNPPWVNRPGPKAGWETWHLHWLDQQKDMVASWKTQAFTPNQAIVKALKNGLKDQ